MKTKLIALSALMIVFAYASQAQNKTSVGGTTFGVRAGANFTNLNGEDYQGNDIDGKLKVGFHVGVNAEIPIAPEFYVQPGVLYSLKGAKSDGDGDIKTHISYIEVPINFLYKPELGDGHLLLGVGPYIGFGIGGKIKGDGEDMDIEFEKEVTPQQAATGAYLKRFDAGGNLLFGYEFTNKFSVQLNAQLGLVNILPDVKGVDNGDAKLKNTGFGVSVGYRF